MPSSRSVFVWTLESEDRDELKEKKRKTILDFNCVIKIITKKSEKKVQKNIKKSWTICDKKLFKKILHGFFAIAKQFTEKYG